MCDHLTQENIATRLTETEERLIAIDREQDECNDIGVIGALENEARALMAERQELLRVFRPQSPEISVNGKG